MYPKENASIAKQSTILIEYLNSSTSRQEDGIPLYQLFQAWSFSAQVNHDSLASAVPALLALLLKTISHILELRDVGLALGKAILQDEHLKLIAKGLGVVKEKEHIISPCLRVLTEVATFDGGSLTSRIHAARHTTLDAKLLTRCLTLGLRWSGVSRTEASSTA